MSRYWKISGIVVLALATLVPAASARPPFGFRGSFGPSYYGPGFYGRSFYGPGWGWYGGPYAYGYENRPTTGSIKFDTKMKDAQVYVDGGYAGTVGQLKTFPLRTGSHDLELRSPDGQSFYQERVTIVPGKTIKLHP